MHFPALRYEFPAPSEENPCPSEKISLRCHGHEFEEFAASRCKYGLQLISSTAEAATDFKRSLPDSLPAGNPNPL